MLNHVCNCSGCSLKFNMLDRWFPLIKTSILRDDIDIVNNEYDMHCINVILYYFMFYDCDRIHFDKRVVWDGVGLKQELFDKFDIDSMTIDVVIWNMYKAELEIEANGLNKIRDRLIKKHQGRYNYNRDSDDLGYQVYDYEQRAKSITQWDDCTISYGTLQLYIMDAVPNFIVNPCPNVSATTDIADIITPAQLVTWLNLDRS